jgi:hypothetical protein
MNANRSSNRLYVARLMLLSGVLILGIIQWSFLPILIQNGQAGGASVLEMSAGHSSKFAAPFKCLFSETLRPCPVRSRTIVPRIAIGRTQPTETPLFGKDEFYLSYHPLRAPPSA